MVGRSPDHVASTLSAMVMGRDALAAYDRRGAGALADYFAYARDRDLYVTYVIINPQADKSKGAAGQPSQDLVAHVVDEDHAGITIYYPQRFASLQVPRAAAFPPTTQTRHGFRPALPPQRAPRSCGLRACGACGRF